MTLWYEQLTEYRAQKHPANVATLSANGIVAFYGCTTQEIDVLCHRIMEEKKWSTSHRCVFIAAAYIKMQHFRIESEIRYFIWMDRTLRFWSRKLKICCMEFFFFLFIFFTISTSTKNDRTICILNATQMIKMNSGSRFYVCSSEF